MSSAYMAGRPRADLQQPFHGRLQSFASEFLDSQEIIEADFRHCTFVNISFKDATLSKSTFLNCVFVNCYFRDTTFRGSSFTGCQFVDCDFHHPAVADTNFKYCRFRGCYLPYEELKHNFPAEPNLRRRLTNELAVAARTLGATKEGRRYQLASIEARQAHLKSAWKGEGTWYREKYQGLRRLQAGGSWIMGEVNGWLWGHGERAMPLVVWSIVLTFLVFPFALYMNRGGLTPQSEVSLPNLLHQSLASFLPTAGVSPLEALTPAVRSILVAESLLGLIVTGLFVTLLFRAISRR